MRVIAPAAPAGAERDDRRGGERVGKKGQAFVKGGCGCLIAFAAIALVVVLTGGRAYMDPFGAACLFVVGGLIGLLVLAIYNKGRRDAERLTSTTTLPQLEPALDRRCLICLLQVGQW